MRQRRRSTRIGIGVLAWLGVFLSGLAIASAGPPSADRGESVSFRSASYADFRQVLTGASPDASVTVPALLHFPDQARNRYAAIVIVHTIVGYQEANEGWQAEQFRRAGFATLTYDSFAARHLTAAAILGSESGPPFASGVADAYAALRLLASDPRIDPGRIGIVGFSFGGEIAHLTAFDLMHRVFVSDSTRFAAHVAYYPAGVYGVPAGPGTYTGAPILMLLGGKDDNWPLAKAEAYLAYAKGAGNAAPIERLVYPDAYHAWTVATLGAPRFYPQYGSTRKCPFILLEPMGPEFLVEGKKQPFDLTRLDNCVAAGRGYAMGYDAAVRAESTHDAIRFLAEHLRP